MDRELRKSDQAFLREYNIKKVRRILRDKGPLSRVELSALASLDKKTITNIINSMLENNEVQALSKVSEGAGRPKENLALSGSFCRCIGLDVGGTHISGVILDYTGEKLCEYSIDLASMSSDMLLSLCDLVINELLKESGLSIEQIYKVGVSFPGHVDSRTGKAILAENMHGWQELSIAELFLTKYSKEVLADDCSRLMALAELRYGAGRDDENFIVFDLGLGIGCGLVINRRIFPGSRGMSGEVGHTIVKVDGPRCTCGRNGCIESLAAGWALTKQATELLEKGKSPILYETTNKNTVVPTSREISLAAMLGDESCKKLLKDAGRYIAIGIINAISIVNPSKVIIGGRLIRKNEIMCDEIVNTVIRESIPELLKGTRIEISELGSMASAMGAAAMCFESFFEE